MKTATVSAVTVTMFFGLMLGALLAWSSPWLTREVFRKPKLSSILSILALGVPIAAVSTVFLSSMQGFGRMRILVLIRHGLEPVGKLFLAAVAIGLGWGLNEVVGAVLVMLAATLAASCYGLYRLRVWFGGGAPDDVLMKSLMAFSLPLVISNLFGIIAPRSDMLVLGTHVSSSDIAVYAAASQTAAVLALIVSAFDSSIMQTIGDLLARRELEKLRSVSRSSSRWALSLGLWVYTVP